MQAQDIRAACEAVAYVKWVWVSYSPILSKADSGGSTDLPS